MEKFPLAVISPELGARSETFIYRHMAELLPGRTAVVVRRINSHLNELDIQFPYLVFGESKHDFFWLYWGIIYAMKLSKLSPVKAKVMRYLKQHEVKVVLSEYLDQSIKWLDVKDTLGIRLFAHAHGYDISKKLRDPAMRHRYLQLESADGIITMSEYSRDKLINLGLSGNNIHVIPYGINVPKIPMSRKSNDTIRCIAVGRMVAKKAPMKMLAAFRIAISENPALRLDYVGDGEYFAEADHYIRHHSLGDKIVLHGSQPNQVVQDLMSKADIFLQHSQTDMVTGDEEGLPVAILEAMAKSLPVVSTRHAGIPEAVLEGVTGFLVDEGDVEGMAKYIIKLANDNNLRKKMGFEGWERAKRHFSWEKEKFELIQLFGFNT